MIQKIKTITSSKAYTLNGYGSTAVTFSVEQQGYEVIGVVGHSTGNADVFVVSAGGNKIEIHNPTNANISATAKATFLLSLK